MKITASGSRTIHSKLTRHQAFASEIHINKERLDKVQQSRHALLAAKPVMVELVRPRMDELTGQFDRLEEDTREKSEQLVDAKRADLYDQSCDDIDSFARDIEAQIKTEPMEELKDLTSVNIMMQLIETQMIVKSQQMTVARKGAFVKDVLFLETFCIN
jgi:spectrin beta